METVHQPFNSFGFTALRNAHKNKYFFYQTVNHHERCELELRSCGGADYLITRWYVQLSIKAPDRNYNSAKMRAAGSVIVAALLWRRVKGYQLWIQRCYLHQSVQVRLYFRLQRSYCLKPAVSVGDRDGWSATTATVNTRVRARSAVCSSAIVATESLFHVLLSVYNSRNTAQTGAAIVRVWSNKSVREPEGRSLALKLNWCTKWWMNLLKVGRWGSLKDECLDSSLFFLFHLHLTAIPLFL